MRCHVEVASLRAHPSRQVAIPDCHWPLDVKVSPEGHYAAFAHERWGSAGRPDQARVAVVELGRVAVVSDRPLPPPAPRPTCRMPVGGGYLGIRWSGPGALQVTWLDPLPAGLAASDVLTAVQARLRHEAHVVARTPQIHRVPRNAP